MRTAVVVDCVRTPIGRSHPDKGWFRTVRSDDLAVACVQSLLERTGIEPAEIDDVLLGSTNQTLEQGLNVARNVGLMAGLPFEATGATVNRLCGSSLQALHQAVHAIMAGCEDVHIVGGLEHMHHLPIDHGIDLNPKMFQRTSKGALMMGVTAEFLSQTRGISRQRQDEFALRSHQRAAGAQRAGGFDNEIVPVYGQSESGERLRVQQDQCVRPDSTLEALATLSPAFMPVIGSVTAGNSSPLNDGAAAMLVMSQEKATNLGLTALAKVRSTAVAGVEPCVMGTGPVPATLKALQRAGLELSDVDVIELNEAFAAQSIVCIDMLGLDEEKVNLRGGAIALGHPLGASGARIATTLLNVMFDRDATIGLATMCIGVGQGIATVFERI